MSKELTNTTNNTEVDVFAGLEGLGQFKGDTTGLEAFDATDLKMPKVRLLQSTSEEVVKGGLKAGEFYNTITKESKKEIHAILLVLGKSRVMWPDKFKRGDDPICRSFDNIMDSEGTKRCDKCPHSNWDVAKSEGKNKPDCNMSYVWLGLDEDSKSPFRITMGGMSVGPTKDFLNVIAPKRLPAFVYHVVLTSKQEENENGVFYTAQYAIKGVIKNEEFKDLQDMAAGLREMFMRAVAADTAHADEAVVEDGQGVDTTSGALF